MHSNKCRNCGLVNADSDIGCRRCGFPLGKTSKSSVRGPREATKWWSPLYMLFAVTLIGGAVYYVYNGFEKSFDEVKANETKRLAAQPKQSPMPLSRSESDQQRTDSYKNAVANSPNLSASQKHNDDIKQLMQPAKQAAK